MMERPIAYTGTKPYIFVSYAHKDNERVWPIIQTLQNRGFRVWYDNGIDPGTEWDKIIAEHLVSCTLFLVVMSENYLASDNCKDELSYSRDLNKNRVIIHLEEVLLPPELAMRIGRSQALFFYSYQPDNLNEFYDNLQKATGMMSCYEAPQPVTYQQPQQQLYRQPMQPQQQTYRQPVQPQQPLQPQQPMVQQPTQAQKTTSTKYDGTKPVYGRGIPGFRSKRPWKRAVAIIGYLQIIGLFFISRSIFSNKYYKTLEYGLPLVTCLYVLFVVFIAVDFKCVNELFSFSTKSKGGHIAAKILEIVILTLLFVFIFILLVIAASATA